MMQGLHDVEGIRTRRADSDANTTRGVMQFPRRAASGDPSAGVLCLSATG